MNDPNEALLSAFDGHDAEGVRAALDAGADARGPIRGRTPVVWLLGEYTRSDRLSACLRLLLDRGAELPDPDLAPVLLDDAAGVAETARARPEFVGRRTTLPAAFTPMAGVTPLHVAAEYGHLRAARALIEAGADVDARADLDAHGLNGQTPLFHTVNANRNRAEPILRLLLDAGARVDVRLAGLRWGDGYDWETVLLDVTPLSYAQMGLLPQMHRDERDIAANVRTLLAAAGRPIPPMNNVPNRYLRPKA